MSEASKERRLVHNVFFTLKDNSPSAVAALVGACHQYLKDHPGVEFFAAGPLEPELNRPVNVRDFDVGLHVVFATREDHDNYQVAPQHLQFIAENKETWAQVRVFDTTVD